MKGRVVFVDGAGVPQRVVGGAGMMRAMLWSALPPRMT